MTRFNELQGTGALIGRGVGQLLQLQEQEGVTTTAPELMPVISLDDQDDRALLQGYSLLMGVQLGVPAGGAGFRSQMSIDNPAGSGVICTLERIQISPVGAESVTHGWGTNPLNTSTGNIVTRDSRNVFTVGFSAPSPIALRISNAVSLASNNLRTVTGTFAAGGAVTTEYIMNIVLGPGTNWRIIAQADNVAITSSFIFYLKSRALNPRELP